MYEYIEHLHRGYTDFNTVDEMTKAYFNSEIDSILGVIVCT